MIKRLLAINKNSSFFLFGPRGTGKTFLLKSMFKPEEALYIDLLQPEEVEEFSLRPSQLSARLEKLPPRVNWVIIDEVQKVPKLLDVVHREIEQSRFKFALTGSSARKLKRGAANLLAGRAFVYKLFPLTSVELGKSFDLQDALEWGTLPKAVTVKSNDEKLLFLRAYAHNYLKEEIQVEQVVRKLDPFRRFLEIAAQTSGTIVNYSKIAEDVGASTVTVQSYFQILEDTLIGILLEPFHQSIRKRQRANPKFYLFDTGVEHAMSKTLSVALKPSTYAFGQVFENFVINEIFRLQNYFKPDYSLSYLRTKDDVEIDLIIERPGLPLALLEIKSSTNIRENNVRSLQRLALDMPKNEAFCLSRDEHPKRFGNVSAIPWQQGLAELGLI